MPKIHPREAICLKAEHDLNTFILELVQKYDLTDGEQIRVIGDACNSWIAGMAKYMIRYERHGDPKKPGGLE